MTPAHRPAPPDGPRRPARRAATAAALLAAASAWAQSPAAPAPAASAAGGVDRAEIDRTQIIGNKELPKVLYIVPWKKPLPGPLAGRPRVSLLDEVLAPLDRAEFRRQLSYRDQVAAPTTPTPAAQEKTQ